MTFAARCVQGVERQSSSDQVRLATEAGLLQARLDGFQLRVLKLGDFLVEERERLDVGERAELEPVLEVAAQQLHGRVPTARLKKRHRSSPIRHL